MFKNYFKTALRNFQTNRLYSFVNIAGLSIGIASCLLIFLYIKYELSFDGYHKNADRIYRLTEILHMPKEDNARAVTSPPIAPALQASIPEIEKSVRVSFSGRTLSHNETKIVETRIMYGDSTLFDIFSFPFVAGDPHAALVKPYSIVLTESSAKKYFGNEPALGKNMKLSDTINLTVTGIMKDVPENSHFTFDCVLSRTTINAINREDENRWFDNNYYTYLLLKKDYPYQQLESKIDAVIAKSMVQAKKETGLWYNFKLQPIKDIHLKSNLRAEMDVNSDMRYVYIFSAAAILILLIACVNFVNLSTAKSVNRSKEVGLRKVVGALRGQLITQFLSESFLYALMAGILALFLTALAIPYFSHLTGKQFTLQDLNHVPILVTYIAIILFVGICAGLYPALLVSSFKPVKAIKGKIKHRWQDIFFRKGLIVFQFTISIILIASTALIFQQLRYIQNSKLGLNKEQVLEVEIHNGDLDDTETLLNELKKIPAVTNVSLTNFSFKYGIGSVATIPEGAADNEVSSQNFIAVDENFLSTFQVPLVEGRNFSKSHPTDVEGSFIVNETAVKYFGWGTAKQAIGKKINWGLGKKGEVIGVTKDFNFASLHDNIKPLIIHLLPEDYGFVAVRVKAGDLQQTIRHLENSWKKVTNNSAFAYSFLDEDFSNLYKAEFNMQSVLGLFTLLSISISCLGIFGLAAFTIRQRFREIGIRKVLGASVTQITALLSKDFLKLVVIAIVIASPVAYFSMHKWLESFAYRIDIPWWVFIVTGLVAVSIAMITVSFQSIKAAVANPVKSLRAE